jgi:large subunit ribosomal protein L30
MTEIKITWKKSCIGFPSKQGRIIESLGLKRLHHSVIHQDSPTILGMVNKVSHLLQVEEVLEGSNPAPKQAAKVQSKPSKVSTTPKAVAEKTTPVTEESSNADSGTIDDLGLSVRTLNILKKSDISSVSQVATMTDEELLGLPSFGAKSLDELKQKLGASR